MSILKQNRRFTLFALILVIGAIFLFGTTAYAADDTAQDDPAPIEATLIVKEVWLTGDTLHINVTERGSVDEQTLELNLRDYAKAADEYVTVNATDSSGRTSNSVTFKNPYFEPTATPEPITPGDTVPGESESAVSDGNNPADDGRPLTPDGTGTVLDNVTDGDGKEFFTVETPDGNTFYLIVDRQRDSDNVYLLNAVNEDDLASMAKPGDGKSVSAIPTPEVTTTPAPAEVTPTPEPEPTPEKPSDGNGTLIFVVIAVIAVGGAAYYFKIVRPKKGGASEPDYEPEDDFDDDEEIDVDSDDEDGDDE
ncbi:hypothetical protein FACS1894219_10300 [Clostridia bacterium]|nr:hypothetical protein FACS1894219_10300 [Clostridia bacterium]